MEPVLIDRSLLDMPVEGRNLRPGSLGDQIGARPTLLVFLRHLGCLFCREWIVELRKSMESDPTFPSALFFHLGTVAQGDAFFSAIAPDLRAVADPEERFYKGLGVPRSAKLSLLDPRVWACGIRATRHGHKSSLPVGDPFVMPGLFLVEGDRVTWKFIPEHMGGLPQTAQIPRAVVV